jgi:predicted HAD superfamily Cof-like phosphohydrolase
MTDVQAMVAEFHGAFGLPNRLGRGKPDAMHERTELRADLIDEEFVEFLDSHRRNCIDYGRLGVYNELVGVDTVAYADALADLVYVAYGAAIEAGIDLNLVLREVHTSNMSKLDADGKPIYREDGKVLKGPNYSAPNIKAVLGVD